MPNYEAVIQEIGGKVAKLFDNQIPESKVVKAGSAYYSGLTGTRTIYFDVKQELASFIDISPITNFVEEQCKIFWKELRFNPRLTPKVLNSWANLSGPGSAIWPHHHTPAPLTAVFYLNAIPEMGNLVLQNPMEAVLATAPYETTYSIREFDYTVKSETGKLVIFPGWIKHYVTENLTKDTRFSMAFNIIGLGGTNALLGKDDDRTVELRSVYTPIEKTGIIE